MQTILTNITVNMSELKKGPALVLQEAKGHPVAVMNHDKVAFYMIEPQLFEAMVEELADQDFYQMVLARVSEKAHSVEVNIDEV